PLLAFSGCGHATTARFQRLLYSSFSKGGGRRPEDFTLFRSLPENIGKLVRNKSLPLTGTPFPRYAGGFGEASKKGRIPTKCVGPNLPFLLPIL
ncbi:MAG: hypothetical protein COV91_00285, partial [Candidatus Taylorbacteria bacterium CG11_big_fil_rev_8_21_14_0_20_46_11]